MKIVFIYQVVKLIDFTNAHTEALITLFIIELTPLYPVVLKGYA